MIEKRTSEYAASTGGKDRTIRAIAAPPYTSGALNSWGGVRRRSDWRVRGGEGEGAMLDYQGALGTAGPIERTSVGFGGDVFTLPGTRARLHCSPTFMGKPEILETAMEEQVVADAIGDATDVLDCGCGSGRIARRVGRGRVDGIEQAPEAARAAEAFCRRVVRGSLTDPGTWSAVADRKYGAIVFCHVLEHLTDPLLALRLASERLSEQGRFIIVLPNVATWRMRWLLLRGRWDYQDEGILDRTHVCFYTHKTARELMARANLRIQREAFLGPMPAAGNVVRRNAVRALRSLSNVASAQSFLFVASPAS
jgi:SAM-dependent methyltransferase